MFVYNTHSDEDVREMLECIGLQTKEELFSNIPKSIRLKRDLDLPEAKNEWQLEKHFRRLAGENKSTLTHCCFLGGGFYDHYIPSVVDAIVDRGEFLTSYTPYQPEMSQGLLQALFEYQQLLSEVTGMDVVNSSCYDGATALAEGSWTACAADSRKANKLLVSSNIWNEYRQVLKTYLEGRGATLEFLDEPESSADLKKLKEKLETGEYSGFVFQSPNKFGVIEDIQKIASHCSDNNALSVMSYNPLLSGLLATPGEMGVDVVTCEGQVLGLPLRAGGSSLGIYATRKKYRKYIPGRLVGTVSDINGQEAFALVYEDREQHVARERATSNICSNQALNAIRSAVYVSYMGNTGLEEIAKLNITKANALYEQLLQLPGVKSVTSDKFFNEFCIEVPVKASEVIQQMFTKGFFAGRDMKEEGVGNGKVLGIAVTEKRSKEELEAYVKAMAEVLKNA